MRQENGSCSSTPFSSYICISAGFGLTVDRPLGCAPGGFVLSTHTNAPSVGAAQRCGSLPRSFPGVVSDSAFSGRCGTAKIRPGTIGCRAADWRGASYRYGQRYAFKFTIHRERRRCMSRSSYRWRRQRSSPQRLIWPIIFFELGHHADLGSALLFGSPATAAAISVAQLFDTLSPANRWMLVSL